VVVALLLGSVAAVLWGVASTCYAAPSRGIGVTRTVLWVGVSGGLSGGTAALLLEGPPRVPLGDLGWLAAASAGILVATYLFALLLSRSDVSLATPVVACDGAIAALAFVVTGERLPAGVYVGLFLMVVGLLVALARPRSPTAVAARHFTAPVTVLLALVSASGYALMLFASAHVRGLPPLWTVVLARGGVTVVALAICLSARLSPVPSSRRAWGLAALTGLLDVSSFTLYVVAARANGPVAAVAVSQYGAVAAFAAVLLLGERVSRLQAGGVCVLALGAATVVLLAG
jgi:drug/metabolite transporter (DMT)-like permease